MRGTVSTVLVIRENDVFSETLRKNGADVTNFPLICTKPVDNPTSLKETVDRLNEYDGLFFTSPAAAEIFGKELSIGKKYRGKIYAMGARSKDVFDSIGMPIEHAPSISSAEELVRSYGSELHGKKFLFVRGDRSLQTIPKMLNERSVVDEVIVYRTVNIHPDNEVLAPVRSALATGKFNWICFFSPSGVDAFCDIFGNETAACVAAIGNTTANRASEKGLNVAFVPQRPGNFANEFVAYLNGK